MEISEFTQLQADQLRLELNALELRSITVKRSPELRAASSFTNRRTLVYTGMTDIPIAIVASNGAVRITRDDSPTVLLVTPNLEGSGLLADDDTGSLWTDSFWVCENGRFKYIKPTSPIPIDGLDLTIDERDDPVLDRMIGVNNRLYNLTDDKKWTKDVLEGYGMRMPRGIHVGTSNVDNVVEVIEDFLRSNPDIKEVVLKETRGAHGDGVMMFDLEKPDLNVDHFMAIAYDIVAGLDRELLLEERVLALPNSYLNSRLNGVEPDYNFRVLTTLDRVNSQAIDSEIRFQPKSAWGVNVSKEAQAVRCDVLGDDSLIHRVHRTAEKATEAVCKQVVAEGERMLGFAGVDLILGRDGEIYTLEVNVGRAGGFGTLCRLDKRPLGSIPEVLISTSLPYLEQRYQARTTVNPEQLRRLPYNEFDLWGLYSIFMRGRKFQQAENILIQMNGLETDEVQLAWALTDIGNKLRRFEVSEQFVDEKLRNRLPTESSLTYSNLMSVREYINRRKRYLGITN